MSNNEVIKLIQELPDSVTMEDILYKLYVRAQVEEGIQELDEGKGIPHEVVMERYSNDG